MPTDDNFDTLNAKFKVKFRLARHFALVKKGDNFFIRNYGRPLKNGMGMTILEAKYAIGMKI